ncbi:MAG: AMP-binding protein [Xanthobacteraceae bacterium]
MLTWGITALAVFLLLTFAAWRRYLWASVPREKPDTCPYSLTEVFGEHDLLAVPHQKGVRWLTEIFSRSAARFPNLPALHIAHTGESLTFAELDARAEIIAAAVAPFLTGPDQVVAVAMAQDNWQIVACHLGILRAGGIVMFLDTTLPDALVTHMLDDAQPVLVLMCRQNEFRKLPTLDVMALPETIPERKPPDWLDDPTQRLAAIFYTSGTTGKPKGVECPHAGYVNLALSYAAYFDLVPGMDASSLSSSLGYDGSISEMYSAWVFGCAVVMLSKEQLRSGPELVAVLREAEVTVLFCPPVLLTTLTAHPETDLPYPVCRYIVPAGEAFPSALVEPWTRGRRQIINTYGPTEASTDTSRQSLRPGEPVTIGPPFPNVTYVILEAGELRPLPHGEVGELCIGGVHLARGYRHLPEQTAQKFIDHPRFGRLYRTGDKCRIDIETQRVHFLGRIDAQLKVRGHRVEVQPVEDMLQTDFSEIHAAALDYQNETLIAFVSAPSVRECGMVPVAPAPAAWAARVVAKLSQQLPAVSVPSQIFLVDKFLMKPVSGKIDRERLPKLSVMMTDESGVQDLGVQDAAAVMQEQANEVAPAGPGKEMDLSCREVLAICRAVFNAPLGLDDGFAEAGGHSILIARLAQQLQAAGWAVPVRALLGDCNTARKVGSRPRTAQESSKTCTPRVRPGDDTAHEGPAAKVLPVPYFTALQVLFLALLYLPAFVGFILALSFVDFGAYFTSSGMWSFIGAGSAIYVFGLAAPFAALLWVLIIKFSILGSIYKSGVSTGAYPKWSRMHLRIWCTARMETFVLLAFRLIYRSAPLMGFVLRQLGAKVDRNLQCAPDAHLSGPLDLLSIENDVAVQTGAYVQTTRWLGQYLHAGPVHLESGCKIGMRAAIAPNVRVGRGSWITPFTPILTNVGPHEMWEGAPARLVGRCTQMRRSSELSRHTAALPLLELANILMQIAVTFCLVVVPTTVIFWLATALLPGATADLSDEYFRAAPLFEIAGEVSFFALVTTWVTLFVTSLLGALFVRCTAGTAGLYPSRGIRGALLFCRMQTMNRIQRQWTWTITGQYLRALAGMRFPKLGASECDIMFNIVPELTTADSQVFWSNGCFTNMLDYSAKHLILRRLDMPRNFFSGNNSVAGHGQFPSNFLLGASTAASDIEFRRQMRTRPGKPITVAGNPPVKFASTSFDEENETKRLPNFSLFFIRVFLFDVVGMGILPITEGLIFTMAYVCFLRWGGGHLLAACLAALLVTEISLLALCVGMKRSLVGRDWGADHATAFWSWMHFAYFFAQDCFFTWCRGPLGFCAGTVLANPLLRWMGCDIGHRTILMQPMQCSDWNAVRIGNDCIFDGILQLHSFENMTLKVKRTEIQDGCAISFGGTIMGGAVIGRESTLLPLALVLKEMSLPTALYHGSPAEPVSITR